MRNVLKNGEVQHFDEVYGYYNNGFRPVEDNGDGTYTDNLLDIGVIKSNAYHVSIQTYEGGEDKYGYTPLTIGNQAVDFTIREWNGEEYELETIHGNVCEFDSGGTTQQGYVSIERMCLYEASSTTQDGQSYHSYLRYIDYFTVKKMCDAYDALVSIAPGVSYDGENVAYNGFSCRVEIYGCNRSVSDEPVFLSASTHYGQYLRATADDFTAYGQLFPGSGDIGLEYQFYDANGNGFSYDRYGKKKELNTSMYFEDGYIGYFMTKDVKTLKIFLTHISIQ